MNQNKRAMRAFKILLIPVCLLTVLLFSNCEVKLDCGSLSKKNPALSISMFQKPADRLIFVHEREKLVLKKADYTFSQPYTFTCETGSFMATYQPPCHCSEEFSALYYLNDTIPFSMHIIVVKPDNELAESYMNFTLAVAGTRVGEQLGPGPEAILQFVEEQIVATTFVENVYFKHVWVIPVTNDPHISRVVIAQDKGLVAFVYDGKLFELKEGIWW